MGLPFPIYDQSTLKSNYSHCFCKQCPLTINADVRHLAKKQTEKTTTEKTLQLTHDILQGITCV